MLNAFSAAAARQSTLQSAFLLPRRPVGLDNKNIAWALDVLSYVGKDGPRETPEVGLGEDLKGLKANLHPTLPGDLK